MDVDSKVATRAELREAEIIATVDGRPELTLENDLADPLDEDPDDVEPAIVTAVEALSGLSTAGRYFLQQPNSSSELPNLTLMIHRALTHHINSKRQTAITDFFSKSS